MKALKLSIVLLILVASELSAADPNTRHKCIGKKDGMLFLDSMDDCKSFNSYLKIDGVPEKEFSVKLNRITTDGMMEYRTIVYTFGTCLIPIFTKVLDNRAYFAFGDNLDVDFGLDAKITFNKEGIEVNGFNVDNEPVSKNFICTPFVDVPDTVVYFRESTFWKDINLALYFKPGVNVTLLGAKPTTTPKPTSPTPAGNDPNPHPPKPSSTHTSTHARNSTASPSQQTKEEELPIGLIAGACTGGVFLLVIISVVICFSSYKQKSKKRSKEEDQSRYGESTIQSKSSMPNVAPHVSLGISPGGTSSPSPVKAKFAT